MTIDEENKIVQIYGLMGGVVEEFRIYESSAVMYPERVENGNHVHFEKERHGGKWYAYDNRGNVNIIVYVYDFEYISIRNQQGVRYFLNLK